LRTHKQTNKHTNPQNSTLTDNKGPLKLSAREPIVVKIKLCNRWKLVLCRVSVQVTRKSWAGGKRWLVSIDCCPDWQMYVLLREPFSFTVKC